jgi:hypothetical protein
LIVESTGTVQQSVARPAQRWCSPAPHAALLSLPGRPAAGGATQLRDPQAARDRHEQKAGDRRQQQRHPDGEYALEGEEGDLHGVPVLQDKGQQEQ